MMVFGSIIDSVNHEKRDIVAGQLSLFDMADTGFEHANEVKFPDVPEYVETVGRTGRIGNFDSEVDSLGGSSRRLYHFEHNQDFVWQKDW